MNYHLLNLQHFRAIKRSRKKINSALELKDREINGAYLTCTVTEFGSMVWFHISDYPGQTLKAGTQYKPFKISNIPKRAIYEKILITETKGINFSIVTDGQVTITPFGEDVTISDGININIFYMQV